MLLKNDRRHIARRFYAWALHFASGRMEGGEARRSFDVEVRAKIVAFARGLGQNKAELYVEDGGVKVV